MAMILDYAPGMSLLDPYQWTVIRAHPVAGATRISQSGGVVTVPANVLRDNHYIGGLRTTLLECASINNLQQSQAIASAPWTPNASVGVTNNAGVAPDGTVTATSIIPNNITSTALHNTTQAITVTAAENIAWSCYLKPAGYFGVEFRFADASSLNGFQIVLDLSAGTIVGTTNIGSGVRTSSFIVPLANGWFYVGVWGNWGGPGTTATPFIQVYDTAAHALSETAYTGDGVSGILAWGAQVERFGVNVKGAPTSYIATTSAALARDVDTVSMTWPFQTQAMWGYTKFIDLGWSARANFEPLVMMTDSIIGNPAMKLMTGSGTGGLSPNHRMNYANGLPGVAGGNQSAAILSPGANYGDTVELFWQLFKDGSVGLQRAINGVALSTITNAGAAPDFLDFASHNGGVVTFYLADGALIGLLRMKVGAGTAPVTTLAQGAAA